MAEANGGNQQPQNSNARRQANYAKRMRKQGYTPHTFWLKHKELVAVRKLLSEMTRS